MTILRNHISIISLICVILVPFSSAISLARRVVAMAEVSGFEACDEQTLQGAMDHSRFTASFQYRSKGLYIHQD